MPVRTSSTQGLAGADFSSKKGLRSTLYEQDRVIRNTAAAVIVNLNVFISNIEYYGRIRAHGQTGSVPAAVHGHLALDGYRTGDGVVQEEVDLASASSLSMIQAQSAGRAVRVSL